MERDLFEELKQSIAEAGAIFRGEREAARVTRYDPANGAYVENPDPRVVRDQLRLSRERA